MTGQISDTIEYEGKAYELCAVYGSRPFDPEAHGFRPEDGPLTACWRGHIVKYRIADDRLRVASVVIWPREGSAVPQTLFGKPPVTDARVSPRGSGRGGRWRSLFGRLSAVSIRTGPTRLEFVELDAPVEFTGRLLLGDAFMDCLYVHGGFQMPWRYRALYELGFEGGRLVGALDRSRDIARVRRWLFARASSLPDWLHPFATPDGHALGRCFASDVRAIAVMKRTVGPEQRAVSEHGTVTDWGAWDDLVDAAVQGFRSRHGRPPTVLVASEPFFERIAGTAPDRSWLRDDGPPDRPALQPSTMRGGFIGLDYDLEYRVGPDVPPDRFELIYEPPLESVEPEDD